jgi:RimJ/RimL family protein N-acetyltransferase
VAIASNVSEHTRGRTIETPRLVLAPHGLEDFEDCAAMWADPVVVRHISGRPSTREDSWSRLARYSGHWQLMGYGYWAVREKQTKRFVGDVGLSEFRRDISPSLDGAPEAGWVLATWAHGRGFATEALAAVLAWHEKRFGHGRTVCMIAPENSASLRVAEKSGYREFTRTQYKNDAVILFERLRP